MLRILPKYFIREHIGPFFFAFSVINSVFILNLLFKQLGKFLSKGIPFRVIFEFLFFNLAWMIALSVPMSVLTATIMAFGRLSAENEITAMRASGISLSKILLSVLAISGFLAWGLIWFNNNVLPDFNHQAKLLALDIARKKPMLNLNSGVLYTDIPDMSILVQEINEKDSVSYVRNVIIDDQSESNVIKTITAENGQLTMDLKTGILEITLFKGELHEINIREPESFKRLEFEKHVLKISMTETLMHRSESGYRGDREKSTADLLTTVFENKSRIAENKKRINDLILKNLEKYSKPQKDQMPLKAIAAEQQQLERQIKSEVNLIKSYQKTINMNLVEVHKKYSIPVACIVFILIGAPLGILTKKQGWATAAGLSIGFFLLYWAFLIGGEILADREIISPFLAMWSANIVVGIIGIYLVFLTMRESTFFRAPNFRLRIRKANNAHSG